MGGGGEDASIALCPIGPGLKYFWMPLGLLRGSFASSSDEGGDESADESDMVEWIEMLRGWKRKENAKECVDGISGFRAKGSSGGVLEARGDR